MYTRVYFWWNVKRPCGCPLEVAREAMGSDLCKLHQKMFPNGRMILGGRVQTCRDIPASIIKSASSAGTSMGAAASLYAALEAPEKVGALVLATPPTAWATRARLKLLRVEMGISSDSSACWTHLDTPPRSKICTVVPRKPRTCREAWTGNCQSSCWDEGKVTPVLHAAVYLGVKSAVSWHQARPPIFLQTESGRDSRSSNFMDGWQLLCFEPSNPPFRDIVPSCTS